MKIDYKITGGPKKEELSNEVKLDIQSRLQNKFMSQQAQNPNAPMAQPAQSDGFGRTV